MIWDFCRYGWPHDLDGLDIFRPELVDRFVACTGRPPRPPMIFCEKESEHAVPQRS